MRAGARRGARNASRRRNSGGAGGAPRGADDRLRSRVALRAPVSVAASRLAAHERVGESRGRATQFAAREDALTQFGRSWPSPSARTGCAAVAGAAARCNGGGGRAARSRRARGLPSVAQFELDRSLAVATDDAGRLALGVYQDLAVGSAPSGSDVGQPGLFVPGATVGAPPDMYSDEGRTGDCRRSIQLLRDTRYEYCAAAPRRLPACGRAPTDHALGCSDVLRRQRRRARDVHEVVRARPLRHPRPGERAHGSLVVGEDLGTVPPEVPQMLEVGSARLSPRVRARLSQRALPAGGSVPRLALATVDTHDLPPMVGWLEQRDIILRSELAIHRSGTAAWDARRARATSGP